MRVRCSTTLFCREFLARVSERIGREQRERAKQRRAELVRTREKTAELRTKLTPPSGTR